MNNGFPNLIKQKIRLMTKVSKKHIVETDLIMAPFLALSNSTPKMNVNEIIAISPSTMATISLLSSFVAKENIA